MRASILNPVTENNSYAKIVLHKPLERDEYIRAPKEMNLKDDKVLK